MDLEQKYPYPTSTHVITQSLHFSVLNGINDYALEMKKWFVFYQTEKRERVLPYFTYSSP
jgi:hypothetical protein